MAICRLQESALMSVVGEDMVLLNSMSGDYFSLDSVGRQMLELALTESAKTVVLAQLKSQFDVSEERLSKDFDSLLGELASEGLVELI